MKGLLSDEAIGELALLRAMVDPDAKAQLVKAINDVVEVQKTAETALMALRAQEATNRDLMEQAQKARDEATKLSNDTQGREREIGLIQAKLIEERRNFEEVRANVDANHAAREAELQKLEASNKELAGKLAEMEKAADQRKADLDRREKNILAVEAVLGPAFSKYTEQMA
jgi:chromosome segregation ATPase